MLTRKLSAVARRTGVSGLSATAMAVHSCRFGSSSGGYQKLEVSQCDSARQVVRGPTEMSTSEAFVETLVSQGVTTVFGIVGSAFMDALDLFPEAGIRFISNAHEQNSVHMADGFARVSGEVGVAVGQNGPGITNFVTAVGAAYWAHSPVVIITPECGSNTRGMGGFQEVPGKGGQMEIFNSVTKYQIDIRNATRFAEQSSYAFDIARYERGPVQINFARDLLYNKGIYTIPEPKDIAQPSGNADAIASAANLLATAKNPVILAGAGVVLGGAQPLLVELAESMGIPVCTSYQHNDAFPNAHPLFMGALGYQGSMAAMRTIKEADVILALGSRLNPFGTLPQYHDYIGDYFPGKGSGCQLIQVDIDHRRLGLTKDADLCIHGDAKQVTRQLIDTLAAQSAAVSGAATKDRVAKAAALKKEWRSLLDEWTYGDSMKHTEREGRVRPRQALREIEKVLPKDVVVSTDIGNVCSVAGSYLNVFNDPEYRQSFLAAMTFGNCQYAFGAAVGAKVAQPDRPCVAMVGDGAWGMSLNELMTCIREEIPVTVVVFNNGQWGAEKKNQVLWFGDRYIGVQLEDCEQLKQKPISYAEIERAMGANGVQVNTPSDVGSAMQAALKAQMTDRQTTVIEVMVTKELGDPFRRDAMKLPVRSLPKYQRTSQTNESSTGQPTDM